MRRWTLSVVVALASLFAAPGLRAQASKSPPKPVAERVVRVPLQDGKVSLLGFSRAVLDAFGLDGKQIEFPDLQVDVGGLRGMLMMQTLRTVLHGSARIAKTADGKSLAIRIDQEGFRTFRLKTRRRLLSVLSQITGKDLLKRNYLLRLPVQMRERKDAPLVLLVHGVDAGSSSLNDLYAHLLSKKFLVGRFDYPNDGPIDETAREFAKLLRAKTEGRRVVLIGYSMGGLVSRYVLEMPGLDPGNVDMLIQIGTPNQGSQLAYARVLMDLGFIVQRGGEPSAWQATLQDGAGEAGWDLRPGSALLRRLNARPRNPAVRYRHIVGKRAVLQTKELEQLGKKMLSLAEQAPMGATATPWIRRVLLDLDEVVQDKGDGAVALKRTKLKGVEAVVVPRSHIGLVQLRDPFVVGGSIEADEHPVFRQVEAWLRQKPK